MELPILNIYISKEAKEKGEITVSINRQIAESLKDIPAEDMVRIMVSLEVDKTGGLIIEDYEYFAKDIRKAIAGLVERAFLAQAEDEKKK